MTRAIAGLAALPALCIIGLLVVVALLGFREDGLPRGDWTLSNYQALLGDPEAWGVLRDTIAYGAITVLVAMVLGVAMAWLVERTDLGWRRTIHTAMVLRVLMPGFLTAMGWLFLFHPRIGTINGWLADLLGLESGPLDVTSVVGMGIVEGITLSAVVFVIVSASLRAMDATLEEAARASGAGEWSVLRSVTLPLAAPSIAGSAVFVATIAVSSVDTPLMLGLGDNIYVFSSYVYVQSRPTDGVIAYGIPAAFSGLLLVVALAVAWWYTRLLARSHRVQVITGKGYRPQPVALGRWRPLALLSVAGYFLWSTFLPVLVVLWMSTQAFVRAPSSAALHAAAWDNYRDLDWSLVGRGLETTVKLMLLAPTIAVVISLAFSWIAVRSSLRWRRAYDVVAFMPQAVPQLIFAFSAVLVALYWSRGWYDLHGTFALLVAIMALVHVAFGTRLLNSGLVQIHDELEEAAATSGAPPWTTLRRVVVPLLRPALVYAWLWLALLSFRDLTIPALVGGEEALTLSAVVWMLFSTNSVGEAAAVTVLMLVLFAPLVALFLAVAGNRRDSPGEA